MKSFRSKLTLVVALFFLCFPFTSSSGFSLFSTYWGNVITVTDMTLEGRERTPPTPENPVYYRGRTLGCKLGSIGGDHPPEAKEMSDFVAKVLKQQGYLGALPGVHEPTLFMVLQWGYMRPGIDSLWFLGYDARQDIAAPNGIGELGPEVFRRGFRSRTTQTILSYARRPIYGIIITAFDYESSDTDAPIILWQTRIALPANAKTMAQALPAMVLAAGSNIGCETDSPVLRKVEAPKAGDITFGELEVLDYDY
jgi:hypothetical protein